MGPDKAQGVLLDPEQQSVESSDVKAARRAAFLLFASSFVYVNVGGRLYLSEAIALAIVFNWFIRARRLENPEISVLYRLAGVWLFVTAISAIINMSSFRGTLQESANILLLVVDIQAVRVLLNRGGRAVILPMVVGGVLAAVGTLFVLPDVNVLIDPWKFAFAVPVTLLLLAVIGPRLSTNMQFGLLLALTAVHVVLGYRSLAGVIGLVALLLWMWGPKKAGVRARRGPASLILVGLLAAGSIPVTLHLYDSLAGGGTLGELARTKYEMQATGKYGVIAGGRKEIFFSLAAISSSPVIGVGPDAPMSQAVADRGGAWLTGSGYRLSYSDVQYYLSPGTVPGHSYLFETWTREGIVAALFWFYMIWCLVRHGLREIRSDSLTPLMVFSSLWLLWNIAFSPLGAGARLTTGLLLCLALSPFTGRDSPAGVDQ